MTTASLPSLDYASVARELLRAWRGKRSQTALSRKLGFSSNVAYTWEAGRRFPTAAEALRCLNATGGNAEQVWEQFYGTRPNWLNRVEPASPAGVAAALRDLRGRMPIDEIAQRSGLSRFAISRSLSGQTQPRLPTFLQLLDAISLRALDWLAAAADITALQSAEPAWAALESQRRAAYSLPWTQAVLRAIELVSYQQRAHEPGWIAERLGIEADTEQACLEVLEASGQIVWDGSRWQIGGADVLDTGHDRQLDMRNKQFWAGLGVEAMAAGSLGQFSYNVFSVSDHDVEKLRRLHLSYFRQLRSIIAESTPSERVMVANVQLFGLDAGPLGPGAAQDAGT